MGYMRHHAIVVTSCIVTERLGTGNDSHACLREAHEKAEEIFDYVSPISEEAFNGYHSFFIPPDGSTEGCEGSNDGDTLRDAFVNWLNKQVYADGSSSLDWVEVQFADDNDETKICRDSDSGSRGI